MRRRCAGMLVLVFGLLLSTGPAGATTVTYLYNLTDFTGAPPPDGVRIYADRQHDEVYTVASNVVRVFNATGMEVFRFDYDPRLGAIFDLAVNDSGEILLLIYSPAENPSEPDWSIVRCNYRGEPRGRLSIKGLPPEFAAIRPNILGYRGGRIYLTSRSQFQAVVIDSSGAFQKGYDLARLASIKEKDRAKHEIGGFSLDRQGNLLFTIPTLFRVFRVSLEGDVKAFGRVGSNSGGFSMVNGVVGDDEGNIVVADKGRDVVLIFDPNFEFIREFGDENQGPMRLVRPAELALGSAGKLYVSQSRQQGVAVFKLGSGPAGAPSGGETPKP